MNEIHLKTKLTTRERVSAYFGIALVGGLLALWIGKNLIPQCLLACLLYYCLTGRRPQILWATAHTFNRDILAARRFIHMSVLLKYWESKNHSVASLFRRNVEKHPNKSAFLIEDKKITFQEIEDLSNKVANYFKSKGYEKEDTIALLMETRLEYSSMWLGLSKIGVITALINTNLRKETLIHSIRVASSKAIIVSVELLDALIEIVSDDEIEKMNIFIFDTEREEVKAINNKTLNLHHELKSATSTPVNVDGTLAKDKLFYIYTSGTTGMPKAAVITNLRFQFMVSGTFMMFGMKSEEVIYNTLPLYHTAGGMLGVGLVLIFGVTMALRKKFSASNFWSDCIKYKCTSAQYIGELCRFLLLTPSKVEETKHNVRFMFGNGLRPQVWPQFVQRFKIEEIGEVYGATESNANLANFYNHQGSVGFVPQIASFLYPVDLIRCDEDTGEPLRNKDGRCMKCEPGEPGVFIGKINPRHAARSFTGYADKSASEKKVIRDVYRQGDSWFNSGDILVMDLFGYFYFKDRTGDTFRWRGENVASTEVEGIVMKVAQLTDCVVYGVDVPENEGKAGMAAIVDPENKLDLVALAAGIKDNLPQYARPVFLRIMPELPMTGTFKLKKRDLQLEGFDITKIRDPIYLLQSDGSYRKLTQEKYEEIKNGLAKLERLSHRSVLKRRGSDSTVSSSVAHDIAKQNDLGNDDNLSPSTSSTPMDCKNPAFILSDKNTGVTKKLQYILGRPWCWGLMFLIMIILTFINTVFFVLSARQSIIQRRSDWGAHPMQGELEPLNLPTSNIIITQTDDAESCFTIQECRERVRHLQETYQNNERQNMTDIPYNYLIGDDGYVYEGRGFQYQGEIPINPSATSFNELGLIIAFIGNYANTDLSLTQVNVFNTFIDRLINSEVLMKRHKIFSNHQLVFIDEIPQGLLNFLEGREDEFYELQKVSNRGWWSARDSLNTSTSIRFNGPAERIVARKVTITPLDCRHDDECIERLQNQQAFDMDDNSRSDIAYNFLIGEHGVFEGRGWDVRPEGLFVDSESITVGIFSEHLGDGPMYQKYVSLYRDGVVLGKIKEDEDNNNIECSVELCPP